MKTIFTLCTVGVLSLLTSKTFAQLSSAAPTKFRINGNLKSNYRLVGSWSPADRQGWYKKSATAYIHLNTDENYVFGRDISVFRYYAQDEYMQSDAGYGNDYSDPPVVELTLILQPWDFHKKMILATRISGYYLPVCVASHKFFSL
jgi:hypothetical protein